MRQDFWIERGIKISELAAAGLTVSQIADRSGMTKQTVRKYVDKFEINIARIEKNKKNLTQKRKEQLLKCHEDGMTLKEAAKSIGLSYTGAYAHAKKHKINFRHGLEGQGVDFDRAEVMASLYKTGKTLKEIGEIYSISRERVRQVISKYHGLRSEDGGQRIRAEYSQKAKRRTKDEKSIAKYGCNYSQYREIVDLGKVMKAEGASKYTTPTRAWHSQRRNAIRRGIDWNLSLWDWWNIWLSSGKWDSRGRTKDSYVMCRIGDAGAYEIGNVYIATVTHNITVQPNNPYRLGHPDHEMVLVRRRMTSSVKQTEGGKAILA
jgi:DNA-binding CsgD family transcriptional regulator